MAKHPVPKRKYTRSRKRCRHSAFQKIVQKKLIGVAKTVTCKNCGAAKRVHFVCDNCGMYRGRQVLDFKVPSEKKNVQKIKV